MSGSIFTILLFSNIKSFSQVKFERGDTSIMRVPYAEMLSSQYKCCNGCRSITDEKCMSNFFSFFINYKDQISFTLVEAIFRCVRLEQCYRSLIFLSLKLQSKFKLFKSTQVLTYDISDILAEQCCSFPLLNSF
ncbi:Hypothetical_protein [Hexamita inflata]|uniref:Hypothetical_protein n=1 Tax=Hexamita inflata TaxID=28002 RepID=A0AA86NQD3_9EUKA|nr:Hypothetical protein HINF_LOCUS11800 [Hexamita inflata]